MDEYDSEVIEVCNRAVKVKYFFDADSDAPWDQCDGHGPVSKWTTRDKHPGERVLCRDSIGRSRRYYDWQEACRMARKDGWNTQPYDAPNRIERAVQADFDFLRAWCDSQWYYVGVEVTLDGESDSLWGVETWKDYHKECAKEMAAGLIARVEEEELERKYWRERDVLTVEV